MNIQQPEQTPTAKPELINLMKLLDAANIREDDLVLTWISNGVGRKVMTITNLTNNEIEELTRQAQNCYHWAHPSPERPPTPEQLTWLSGKQSVP